MRTLALLLTGLSAALTAPAASVPRPSPELTMQRGGAAPLQLSQFRGKIVALAFGHSTCDHCQFLTRTLSVIQKDYAARNVQVVECIFEDDARINYPMFLKAIEPAFPTGYTTEAEVKKYLLWNDKTDGILMIPYMIFIDASGTIRGDFNGKDGFFGESDKRIRAELDKMTKKTAGKAPVKKKEASK
jgi:thiol-disulfide isomerase/thioredoxin